MVFRQVLGPVAFALWLVAIGLSAWQRHAGQWQSGLLDVGLVGAAALLGWSAGGSLRVSQLCLGTIGLAICSTLLDTAAWSGRPLVPPLGYANANAALFVVGIAALMGLIQTTIHHVVQAGATALSALLLLALWFSGSEAGLIAGVVLAGHTALLAAQSRSIAAQPLGQLPLQRVTPAVVAISAWGAGAIAFVGVMLPLTVGFLKAGHLFTGFAAATHGRDRLWGDAIGLFASSPILGHGPGRYSALSPSAVSNDDFKQAHSWLLETLADLGMVGGIACLATIVAGLVWSLGAPVVAGRTAAMAWALGIAHANFDYTFTFVAVPTSLTFTCVCLASLRSTIQPRRRSAAMAA